MTIRTIKGRIVLAIVLVGCVPLLIGLLLAYMSGMQSLRTSSVATRRWRFRLPTG